MRLRKISLSWHYNLMTSPWKPSIQLDFSLDTGIRRITLQTVNSCPFPEKCYFWVHCLLSLLFLLRIRRYAATDGANCKYSPFKTLVRQTECVGPMWYYGMTGDTDGCPISGCRLPRYLESVRFYIGCVVVCTNGWTDGQTVTWLPNT